MVRYLLLALFSWLAAQVYAQSNYCIKDRFAQTYTFDSSAIKVTTGVTYAVSARWPAATIDSLKLDVFEPDAVADTLTKRPFILLAHGGAFLAGNRADMHYQCMEYARRGFVAATISYRLGWNCAATDLLGVCAFCQGENYKLQTATYRAAQDARAALRYMAANAATYGIDTAWLFAGGESAGSITAMHATFWSQQEADVFAPWAVGEVGLLDTAGNQLPNNYTIKGVIDNCGAVSRDTIVLNNGNIPVISFHDENDCVVPTNTAQVISCTCSAFYWAAGSSTIHSSMQAAGLCHEMNLVPVSLNHCSYPSWNLVRRASCFLKRIMCNECTGGNNTTVAATSCDTLQQLPLALPVVKMNNVQPLLYYPNPATGPVTLDVSNLLSAAPLTITLRDATGRVVEQTAGVAQPQYTLQTTLTATGIYFITVEGSTGVVATGKLVR
ncbi:MAG TPA: T9SS type A sorting domain-containing protein [Chitinophagales bacterium]|nr:T9SS type A sorting domain-containing protein [Chitinophagales bacterium]